jgi:hypothetical protein
VAGLNPEALQQHRQRTESGKRGLEQVGADECGEPKPIDTDEMREKYAQEDYGTRESQNPAINAHCRSPFFAANNYLRVSVAYNIIKC